MMIKTIRPTPKPPPIRSQRFIASYLSVVFSPKKKGDGSGSIELKAAPAKLPYMLLCTRIKDVDKHEFLRMAGKMMREDLY